MERKAHATMTRQEHTVDLTPEEVLDKRRQLLDDGFCVVPGVLRGDLLARMRRFSDEFLDTHDVDHRYRYQGSDFHVMAEEAWAKDQDPGRYHDPIVDELLNLPAAVTSLRPAGAGRHDLGRLDHPVEQAAARPAPLLAPGRHLLEPPQVRAALAQPRVPVLLPRGHHPSRTAASASSPAPTASAPTCTTYCPMPTARKCSVPMKTHLAFTEQPGETDVPCKAGDLVIADGRVLHAAWPNNTDTRRTLVLEWWGLFPFPSVPTWWEGEATRRSPRRPPRHLRTLPQAHPPPPLKPEIYRPPAKRRTARYRIGRSKDSVYCDLRSQAL